MFAQEAPSDSVTKLILVLLLAGFVICLLLDLIDIGRGK